MEEDDHDAVEVVHVDNGSVDRLEMRVRARPFDYNAHLDLLAELRRKATTLPDARARMRAARDAFAATWPLPEEVWVELLQDEIQGADLNDETQRAAAEALCRRALADYLSVDLWVLCCELVQQSKAGGGAQEVRGRVRAAFEEALASGAGVHVVEGSKLWAAYRDAEAASGPEAVAKLFLRQLAVPLSGMEATLGEFEEFAEANHIDEKTRDAAREAYEKARTLLLARVPYERAIADSGTTSAPNYDKLPAWHEYLTFEQTQGTPQQVVCLFERACKTYALYPEMWLAYIRYSEATFGAGSETTLRIYARAVRNAPSSGSIWAGRLRALEWAAKQDSEIEQVLDQAKEALINNAEGLSQVLNANIDRVRRLCGTAKDPAMLERLRKVCSDAVELVSSRFPRKGFEAELLQQWGRFEFRVLNDPKKGHDLWERAMRSRAADALSWL